MLSDPEVSAMLPVVAWLAPALINVVTGSVVVEQVFGIPGMGRYFIQGALNRDYTLVLGVVLVVGALIVAINTLVDALRGGWTRGCAMLRGSFLVREGRGEERKENVALSCTGRDGAL